MRDREVDEEEATVAKAWALWGIKGSKLTILGDTGYPDRIFWIPGGKPYLMEFKRSGYEPEPKQQHIHDELRTLGYDVGVFTDAKSAIKALSKAVDAAKLRLGIT